MWAIMVIAISRNGQDVWNTHEQASDYDEAKRIAGRVNGAVVPWDMRLLLLDNGLIEQRIQISA